MSKVITAGRRLALFVGILMLASCSPSADEAPVQAKNSEHVSHAKVNQTKPAIGAQYTYVLVHGASGGGWDWKTMDELLTADGHTVYRPTLTGLGENVHLSNPDIDLTTHINDIANVILFEDLKDVVLVGHSYGGMVITGVI
jgi:pimeloyl-ACP methyl ester carboxylesterase